MKLQVVNGGAGVTEVEVGDATFGREFNESLVHQVVVAYRNAGRSGTKAQKTKAEVRGGGRKPWGQKGTGSARAGSIRSPIWVGGGRAGGAAGGMAVGGEAELARTDRLVVVPSLELEAPKTKLLSAKLKELSLDHVLILVEAFDEKIWLAARNLPYVHTLAVTGLDPDSLVRYHKVLVTVGALKMLEERLS